jgi:hypothetical protein
VATDMMMMMMMMLVMMMVMVVLMMMMMVKDDCGFGFVVASAHTSAYCGLQQLMAFTGQPQPQFV